MVDAQIQKHCLASDRSLQKSLAHLLSLRSGVTEDNVDSEHLHDDGAKRKRRTKSQKP